MCLKCLAYMKTILNIPVLILLLVAAEARAANDEPLQNPALQSFYFQLQKAFHRHYPQATSHLLKNKIHFEHDTRVFLVHELLKTGEWHDPVETRGPKPGGILCDITFMNGPYLSALKATEIPQTLDKRYFKVLVMAPYSAKLDTHLEVHLSYPGNVSGDFVKEFTELVKEFQKYVD